MLLSGSRRSRQNKFIAKRRPADAPGPISNPRAWWPAQAARLVACVHDLDVKRGGSITSSDGRTLGSSFLTCFAAVPVRFGFREKRGRPVTKFSKHARARQAEATLSKPKFQIESSTPKGAAAGLNAALENSAALQGG